ncbi:tyrosine recombinase XerS [Lactococcus lactis]|uniref:tyrosine recombinase XerS n=2 Tax=Lactococcus TaxID=1357 RepID=UPI00288EA867|nr:tyrosine recombinase XerS [Lactococcus lactis]MDT2861049.1 tyrosine recombinase XerS [Lactococcus lactis]MDT2914430.1 tyrosine recombinase XerS [Lactococcus lactis]MDT2938565.1 tyrosine recombinase XerS [Lactococcus lactis]
MNKQLLLKHISSEQEMMPFYINEYVRSMQVSQKSYTTIYEYLKEFHRFFDWLYDSGIISDTNYKELSMSILEHLKKQDIESYILYLRERPKYNTSSQQAGLSQTTINRTISALSSLFNYLTRETENEEGEPYFYRNVMDKIKTVKSKQTLNARAASIKNKLFLGEDSLNFLEFIDHEYINEISPNAKSYFLKNKARDLAIIALILGTGIRLSECTNADVKHLNLKTLTIEVTRKGGKKDVVSIAPFTKIYIEKYLDLRKSTYLPDDKEQALFLSKHKGIAKRIDNRTVENLVGKYSKAFRIEVSPHKLRHTLATRLYSETKNQALIANQLGHTDLNTSAIYISIVDDENRKGLDQL